MTTAKTTLTRNSGHACPVAPRVRARRLLGTRARAHAASLLDVGSMVRARPALAPTSAVGAFACAGPPARMEPAGRNTNEGRPV